MPATTTPIDDDALSEALRALAHADRRQFVGACMGRSQSAGELAAMSSLAPATASEHLKVLRKTSLLELDVHGRFWYYRTNVGMLRAVIGALERLAGKA